MAVAERTETVDLPLLALYEVICRYEDYPQFVSGMKATKIKETTPQGEKIVSFDLELVKRVQYTVKIKESLHADQNQAHVEWDLVESEFLKVSHGEWTLKMISPHRTEVTYKLEVEFKFPVPSFVLKGIIATSMPLAIQEFKNQTQKKVGQK